MTKIGYRLMVAVLLAGLALSAAGGGTSRASAKEGPAVDPLDSCNVVWDSPSGNGTGPCRWATAMSASMPG